MITKFGTDLNSKSLNESKKGNTTFYLKKTM